MGWILTGLEGEEDEWVTQEGWWSWKGWLASGDKRGCCGGPTGGTNNDNLE